MKRTAYAIVSIFLCIHICLAQSEKSIDGRAEEMAEGGAPLKSRRRLQSRRLLEENDYGYKEYAECYDYSEYPDGCRDGHTCNPGGSCVIRESPKPEYVHPDYGECDEYLDYAGGCREGYTCDTFTASCGAPKYKPPPPKPRSVPARKPNPSPVLPMPPPVSVATPSPSPPTPPPTPITTLVPANALAPTQKSTPAVDFAPLPTFAPAPGPTLSIYGSPPPSPPSSSTSIGVIVGAAIGGFVILAGIIAGAIFMHRRKLQQALSAEAAPHEPPAPSNVDRDGIEAYPLTRPGNQQQDSYTNSTADVERGIPQYNFSQQGNNITRNFDPHAAPTVPSGQPPPTGTLSVPAIATYDQLHFPPSPTNSTETTSIDFGQWSINFNDLQMMKPIGSGSFGRVYLAMWHESPVAVKVLLDIGVGASSGTAGPAGSMVAASLSSPSPPASLIMRLKQEAGIMASLRHPNVVGFLGVCSSPACILSEYCSRGSLYDVLREAKQDIKKAAELTWERRIAMALDAAQGMSHLHYRSQPIVHRDLKSPNLLVDERWTVKVADFNLSRLLTSEARSMTMATNPRWLPPEMLAGGSASPAGDVFAFGVVLWEFISWKLPWTEVNPFVIVGAVQNGQRPAFPEDMPGPDTLPSMDRYKALIEKCWAQEPAQRPTFIDIVRELRAQLEELGGGRI